MVCLVDNKPIYFVTKLSYLKILNSSTQVILRSYGRSCDPHQYHILHKINTFSLIRLNVIKSYYQNRNRNNNMVIKSILEQKVVGHGINKKDIF